MVLARHAESELNADNILNGDPARVVGLTERGREQARELGAAAGPVDVVAHTAFGRTKQTAELAWPGTPTIVVPELNEIAFGGWEGTRWDEGYGEWARTAGPLEECEGGGESRQAAAQRYVEGFRMLLGRPEDRVGLVTHGASLRYLILAAEGRNPMPILEHVQPAQLFAIDRDQLARAVDVLERWAVAPAF